VPLLFLPEPYLYCCGQPPVWLSPPLFSPGCWLCGQCTARQYRSLQLHNPSNPGAAAVNQSLLYNLVSQKIPLISAFLNKIRLFNSKHSLKGQKSLFPDLRRHCNPWLHGNQSPVDLVQGGGLHIGTTQFI